MRKTLSALVLPAAVLAACHGPSRCAAPDSGASSKTAPAKPPFVGEPTSGESVPALRYIVVDQFGYRPESAKVAVLASPVRGWNAGDAYVPGATLEVRRFRDASVVYAGAPSPWHGGTVDEPSGDRGSWFDFSSVTEPGTYFVYDPTRRVRSFRFQIRADVYRDVLEAAERAFYFNRANVAKRAPHACVGGKCWILGESYLGRGQDSHARSVRAREDETTERDLSGGWWDAGDVNKYVTYACAPVHQLLTAYWEKPRAFTDDVDIPESKNQIPDLLDELHVELDWLQKMQPDDLRGGVLLKVGNVLYGDPIPDQSHFLRYYYPAACSSATIDAASVFAHAALIFRDVPPLAAYAEGLGRRAVRAWAFYRSHPPSSACDDGTILAPGGDRSLVQQEQAAVVAAVYLFALTGEQKYEDELRAHLDETRPFREDDWSAYDPEQGDALLFYTTLPSADAATRSRILERKAQVVRSSDVFDVRLDLDLYRASLRRSSYHWGSNGVRANVGNTNYDVVQYRLEKPEEAPGRTERALGSLHSFHGVNPMQLVYLTNMAPYGATRSASEMFHAWFRDGDPRWDSASSSELGPPPGYLTGGPNAAYCERQDPATNRCATSELRRQPPGKAYLDFNTGWNPEVEHDRSWEITEPAISYQAAYVKLVSKFVD